MKKRKVQIANLRVRLPKEMAGDAKSIASGIGNEVMRSIADAAKGKTGSISIDEISAGKFKSSMGVGAIQKQVAANVANAAAKKIGEGGK